MSTETGIPDLDCRLLAQRYADRVDRRAFDDATALFTPDGVLAVPRGLDAVSVAHEGHDAIRAALAQVRFATATLHEISGHVLDPAGDGEDRRTGRTWCRAHHLIEGDDGVEDLLWTLRYDDVYVREDGAWRFARRELAVLWEERPPVSRLGASVEPSHR